ncbi:MAG: homocysteine S-methyltransferase family protein, partial [Pseudomonadota bacterium]
LLRDWAEPFEDRLAGLYVFSYIGPRGDAYGTGGAITADEAEKYHTTQLVSVRDSVADGAMAATFNNIPEAVGLARAAKALGVPLGISLTLTSDGVLRSGPSLKEAIEDIDKQTGDARPDFYMVNCAHPTEFGPSLVNEPWLQRIRGFVPNAVAMEKVALCKLGHIEDGDPVELGGQLAELAGKYPWMDIWGGCCGTGAPHLLEIAKEVAAVRAT